MNYLWHYNQLMETRKDRILDKNSYYEKHHIVPKCMGGSDDTENLIILTAREHFIAHWLLHRIHPHNHKLSYAFYLMASGISRGNKRIQSSSISYEEAKMARRAAIIQNNKKYKTGHVKSEETLKRISDSLKGKKKTEEHKNAISNSLKGKKKTDEHRDKLSESLKGYDWSNHKERNEKISKSNSGSNNGRSRKVCMLDVASEMIISEFDTMKEALEFLKNDNSTVSKTTLYRRMIDNKPYFGYTWKFKTKNND